MSRNLSGHQTKNATPKPTISLSQPGLLQRTCECGGIPGLTGQCEECSSKRLSGQRGTNPPALPNNPPNEQPTGQIQRSPLEGYSFGNLAIAPKEGLGIQTKLAIGQPGDRYEQEADRVAEQVMRSTKPVSLGKYPLAQPESPPAGGVQKKSSKVPPIVHEVLNSPGQPLDTETRTFMEPRFGNDFSQVRVHTDALATRQLKAAAFTVGSDIVFGSGTYSPKTQRGQQIIAHELVHVLQHRANPVRADAPLAIQDIDPDSITEERFISVGIGNAGSPLVVVYTLRGEVIRLISARRATKQEIKAYEKGI